MPGACVSAPLGTLHGTLAWHFSLLLGPGLVIALLCLCWGNPKYVAYIIAVYSVRHGTKRITFPLPSGRRQTKSLVLGARLGTMYNI